MLDATAHTHYCYSSTAWTARKSHNKKQFELGILPNNSRVRCDRLSRTMLGKTSMVFLLPYRICRTANVVRKFKQENKMHKIHPYANIFPMLSKDELAALAEDIKQHGQREPIVLNKAGLVLDGRNRLAACEIAEVDPEFVDFNNGDELAFVLSANLHRRHLTTSQRASVAAKLLPIYEEQASKRKKSGKKNHMENLPYGDNGTARDQAGAALSVSGKTVDMAAKVHREAVTEVVQALERGDLAVSAALVIAELPREKQEELASCGVQAMRDEVRRLKRLPFEPEGIIDWSFDTSKKIDQVIENIPEKYRREIVLELLPQITKQWEDKYADGNS